MNIIGIKILNTTHLYDDAVTNKHGQRTECEDRARNLKFIICKNVRQGRTNKAILGVRFSTWLME